MNNNVKTIALAPDSPVAPAADPMEKLKAVARKKGNGAGTPEAPKATEQPKAPEAPATDPIAAHYKAEIARLTAENEALRAKAEHNGKLSLKVSEKGGVSVYGLGKFPVTLYQEQFLRLLDFGDEIRAFIKANASKLKAKAAK
jgi:hypothetical protein